MYCNGIHKFFSLTEQILTKYEEAHRRRDGTGVKILDFYIKKKTDHYNNVMNT